MQVSGLTNLIQLGAGPTHSCALRGDGTVWCWGANNYGQLGDGLAHQSCGGNDCSLYPVQVTSLTGVQAIATSGMSNYTCAIDASDDLWCWGANQTGQIGDNSTTQRPVPVQVSGVSGVISVATSDAHTCAAQDDNRVFCWGDNGNGCFGTGDLVDSLVPIENLAPAVPLLVTAGRWFTCAWPVGGGAPMCWGEGGDGQLGDGSDQGSWTPISVVGLSDASHIVAGEQHVCAVTTGGDLYCWGNGAYGQLGTEHHTDAIFPELVLPF